jgi:hypothetical protein
MRNYLILLLLFLTGQATYSQNTDTSDNKVFVDLWNYPDCKVPIADSLPLKCKIFRIKKIEKAYIIDILTENREFKYTIISLKSEKQNLKKIKKGKLYEFTLFAYYDVIIISDPGYRRGTVYTIKGVPITFMEDFKTGEIVTTPNLKGLYYVP